MARRIARLEREVLVTHRQVALYDDGGDQDVPDLRDTSQWLFAGDNVVLAISTGWSEVWPAAVPPMVGSASAVTAATTSRCGPGDGRDQ